MRWPLPALTTSHSILGTNEFERAVWTQPARGLSGRAELPSKWIETRTLRARAVCSHCAMQSHTLNFVFGGGDFGAGVRWAAVSMTVGWRTAAVDNAWPFASFNDGWVAPLLLGRGGTQGFRAPEVLLGSHCQTCRIDIWSAGHLRSTLQWVPPPSARIHKTFNTGRHVRVRAAQFAYVCDASDLLFKPPSTESAGSNLHF